MMVWEKWKEYNWNGVIAIKILFFTIWPPLQGYACMCVAYHLYVHTDTTEIVFFILKIKIYMDPVEIAPRNVLVSKSKYIWNTKQNYYLSKQ